MFDLQRFAEAVRAHRGEKTLRDVAAETGLSITAIMRIEKAQSEPGASTFATLCEWMGTPMDTFTLEAAA